MVSAQINQNNPDDLTANRRPIEFLTENGYAIVRSWEIDRVPVPINGTYSFVVKREQGPEREIVVTIAAELFANILRQTRAKISNSCSFWICCAERHLANYLWEKDDYPPGDELAVDHLDPEDVMSAVNWGTQTEALAQSANDSSLGGTEQIGLHA
jgi:hypothetical protein